MNLWPLPRPSADWSFGSVSPFLEFCVGINVIFAVYHWLTKRLLKYFCGSAGSEIARRGIHKLSEQHAAIANYRFSGYKRRLYTCSLWCRGAAGISVLYCAWILYCRALPPIFLETPTLVKSLVLGTLVIPFPLYLILGFCLTVWERRDWGELAKQFQPQVTKLPDGLPADFEKGSEN